MRFRGSNGLGPRRGIIVAASALISLLAVAYDANAQSAADKATARQVATEGISLFNAGNYADALDRMRRAQALYAAPVHLLYIARSEVKLSQLVEAAEDYQTLVRFSLPPNPPKAFADAVEDGKKELAELEPRIPKLQLKVEPANVQGVELTIDDKPVPAAVIGIERPINPGAHQIKVKAPGYKDAASSVDVKEAETKTTTLTLEQQQGGQAPAAGAAAAGPPSADKGGKGKGEAKPSPVGFLLGARLGLAFPTGTVEQDIASSDLVGPGVGLELHGGVRLFKYFTPLLFFDFDFLHPSDKIKPPNSTSFNNSATASEIGLGVIVGTPRNQAGGFGELDAVFSQSYYLKHQVVGVDCTISRTWSGGPMLRLGGGAVIPYGKLFHLTPFAMASIGKFNHETTEHSNGCADYGGDYGEDNVDLGKADRERTHVLLFLGVGGDFVLGSDRPNPPVKK